MSVHVSSTVVLIIRRLKLYYRASGIVTPVGGRPVRRVRESSLSLSCDDTRCCITEFDPLMMST